jgi:hypothetical protein
MICKKKAGDFSMTQQAFLRYMSVLCGGEAAKYACEEAVKELEKQLAAIRDPYEPAMPDRDSVTRGVHLKKTEDMGGAGCVVAVILVFLITFLIDTNTQTGLDGSVVLAVLAVLAGNDLLCSTEYQEQYRAVLEAVNSGRITPEQLDASVERILRWKQGLGML